MPVVVHIQDQAIKGVPTENIGITACSFPECKAPDVGGPHSSAFHETAFAGLAKLNHSEHSRVPLFGGPLRQASMQVPHSNSRRQLTTRSQARPPFR